MVYAAILTGILSVDLYMYAVDITLLAPSREVLNNMFDVINAIKPNGHF